MVKANDRAQLAGTEFHITRVSGLGVFGHATTHCDESGCAGNELFLGTPVAVDWENNAEVWWDALRLHPRGVELEEAIDAGVVAPDDLRMLKALPGWSDGPAHARTALLVGDEMAVAREEAP